MMFACKIRTFDALIDEWEKKKAPVPKPKICGLGEMNYYIPIRRSHDRMPRSLILERTVSSEYALRKQIKTSKMPDVRLQLTRRLHKLITWHNIRLSLEEYKQDLYPVSLMEKTVDTVLSIASREPRHIDSCDVTLFYTRKSWRLPGQPLHHVECLGTIHNAKTISTGIVVVYRGVKRWSKDSIFELINFNPFFVSRCMLRPTVVMVQESIIVLKYPMDYHGYFYRLQPQMRMIDGKLVFSVIEEIPEEQISKDYHKYCVYY